MGEEKNCARSATDDPRKRRRERRIRDPICHVPVLLYMYIHITLHCNPVNVKIPRVQPRSICLDSNYHIVVSSPSLFSSILFADSFSSSSSSFVFLTRRPFIEINGSLFKRKRKGRLFLPSFLHLRLLSTFLSTRRPRTIDCATDRWGKFKSFRASTPSLSHFWLAYLVTQALGHTLAPDRKLF